MNRDKLRLFPLIAIVTCLAVAAFGLTAAPSGADQSASIAKKKCKKKKKKCKKGTGPITTAPVLKPALTIDPSAVGMPSVNQAPVGVPFQVTNTGPGPTANLVTTVTTNSGSYGQFTKSGGDCGAVLAAGAKCTVVVFYTGGPNQPGPNVLPATGSLTASDAANGVSASAQLNGSSIDTIL